MHGCKRDSMGQGGADYIVESTGVYTTIDKAKAHLEAGARRLLSHHPRTLNVPLWCK